MKVLSNKTCKSVKLYLQVVKENFMEPLHYWVKKLINAHDVALIAR